MRLEPTWRLQEKKEVGRGGDTKEEMGFSVRVEKKRKDGQEISEENTRQKKPLSEVS